MRDLLRAVVIETWKIFRPRQKILTQGRPSDYPTTMSSTPKRQKNRDGSYTPTPTYNTESDLKRKGQQPNDNDPDDPLLAAYNNPYLAHMLPDQGYLPQVAAGRGPLKDFHRRQSTAKQAEKAEDGPDNPFTLRPLGRQYFDILKKRRDLPVHAQRHVPFSANCTNLIVKSSLICIIRPKSWYLSEKQDQGKPLKSPSSYSTTNCLTSPPLKSHVPNLVVWQPCPSQNVLQTNSMSNSARK